MLKVKTTKGKKKSNVKGAKLTKVELVSKESKIVKTVAKKAKQTTKLPVASKTLADQISSYGITKSELARTINMHPSSVGRLASGKRNFTINTDLRITKAFDLQEGTLIRSQLEENLPVLKKKLSPVLKNITTLTPRK